MQRAGASIATTRSCSPNIRSPSIPRSPRRLLADAWLARGPGDEDTRLLRRLRFAGQRRGHRPRSFERPRTASDRSTTVAARARAAAGRAARPSIATRRSRSPCRAAGTCRLEYDEDGSVSASVKLQELFGLAETPRIGPRREPVLLALLGAERAAGADDARSAQLLGSHLSGGAKGTARPLPEAPVARGSVDRAADGSRETQNLRRALKGCATTVRARSDRACLRSAALQGCLTSDVLPYPPHARRRNIERRADVTVSYAAGLPAQHPSASPDAGIHGRCRARAGAGHRRQHRRLLAGRTR